ncbi:MAG: tRNA threonylcarbamoyladenosine dehydratase [Spirochaetaceae bacterium]|nr:tRNA threonylcarbamoyladenosine dehydratase [Spirochaetaceae bacterium]
MFDIQRTFSRTELLIGKENIEKLRDKKVAIFGLGGVGSFVTEGIIRCGIKNLILVDNDEISPSNINRQLYALQSTIGKKKTDLAKERCLDINPLANIQTFNLFYLEETQNQIDLSDCDYIIDAIDTVSAKLLLIENAKKFNVPIISSMGTGNKLNPFAFQISDIFKTSVCPLARTMRYELKKRGYNSKTLKNLKVLFSTENPASSIRPPASISFVPSVAGLMIASEVIKDLCNK